MLKSQALPLKLTAFILIMVILSYSATIAFKSKEKERSLKGNFLWHWHRRANLSKKSIKKIIQWDIKGIFFHIGEFTYYKDRPQFNGFKFQLDTFERLNELNGLQIHLVFTFSGSSKFPFIKYFNNHTESAISFILEVIDSYLNICRAKGLEVSGIQLDMEYRVQFEKYKRLIDTVAEKFGNNYLISITPRANWYRRKEFTALIEKTDFIVPMFYDYAIGKKAKSLMKVTDSDWIKSSLKKYKLLNKPFYAGIPTYSYSKIYDEKGNMIESWAKLSVEKLSENPDFKLVKSKYYKGDNIYVFKALRATKLVNYRLKKGAVVRFNIVTPKAVNNYIEIINEVDPDNLLGIAFFRYGYPREDLVINEEGMDQVFNCDKSGSCIPEVDVLIDKEEYNQLSNGGEVKLNLVLINAGNQDSYTSDSANELTLKVENGKITNFNQGDFGSVKKSENLLVLSEKHLSKNEAVYSGLVRVNVETVPLILKIQASSIQLNGKKQLQSEEKLIKIFPQRLKFGKAR